MADARMQLEASHERLRRKAALDQVRTLLDEASQARSKGWNDVARERLEHALLVLRSTAWTERAGPHALEREARRALATLPRR